MPSVSDTAKMLALKKRIASMTAADQLRVCAGLIEEGEYVIAETLTSNVVDALRARRLLARASAGKERS